MVGHTQAILQPCDADTRTDLLFTQEHNQDKEDMDENSVRELLNRVRMPGFQESQLPSIFRSLVHSMRKLQHSELVLIHNEIAANRRCKKLFEDALPLLKTDPEAFSNITTVDGCQKLCEKREECEQFNWYQEEEQCSLLER